MLETKRETKRWNERIVLHLDCYLDRIADVISAG